MILTRPQQITFWRRWQAIVSEKGWDNATAETQRRALLGRAGFTSLTQVDKLAGFDKVLAELSALSRPADLSSQLRQQAMPRTRLIHSCREKADEPYIAAVARDKFHCEDWITLPLPDLEQLRNTLADRAVGQHKNETLRRRHAQAAERRSYAPPARISLPAPVPSPELAQECVPGPF